VADTIVLGISGRDRDAAAALSVNGNVVAAVAEESVTRVPNVGYARTGGFPYAAAQACLDAARLDPSDVQQIVVVDDAAARPSLAVNGIFRGIPVKEMAAERADAVQAMTGSGAPLAVVAGADPAGISIFRQNGSGLGPREDVPGADGLVRSARKMASLLGVETADSFAGLDRASVGGDAEFQHEIAAALSWRSGAGVVADDEALADGISRIAGEHAPGLADVATLNARVQQLRRGLAASYLAQVATTVGRMVADVGGGDSVAAGGSLFSHARINTELGRDVAGQLRISQVPEREGRAIGAAALEPGPTALVVRGPAFSDEDIKRTLDNCRLDYVYEPDWARLIARTSKMLAQGKVMAWFQGAMAFGPRPLGTRSILTDPSSRYARQNVNEYLRHSPIDEPLPVAFATSALLQAVPVFASEQNVFGVRDAAVSAEARARLSGAVDWRNHVRLAGRDVNPEAPFHALLEHHFAETGTPGLIETGLAAPGEPIACTPRDAVRTMFSSAIDALVIGRFLLMKDYWLLRGQNA
jgi:carbamoyltransferase